MNFASIKVEGLDKLIDGLDNLSQQAKNRITRNSSKAGAQSMQRTLKANAPRGRGERSQNSIVYGSLQKNIKVTEVRADGKRFYRVTTGDAFWAWFLNYGTGKYNTNPGPKAKGNAAKSHMKGNDWFDRAVETGKSAALDAMIKSASSALKREIAKIK